MSHPGSQVRVRSLDVCYNSIFVMTAGTQWSEYYWKDQTVMLLMLEPDFPDGKNPDFCAKLFREEPGVWKLKMEQFKRFVWVRLYREG